MSGQRSRELFERASRLMPGGVNSPVRAYRAVGGSPPFVARAEGARVFDEDGREYVDLVGSWGPALVGHAHPDVVARVQAAAARGLSFGAPTAAEVELAEAIRRRFPSMEMLRCTSSGTEATMSALRVARGFTARDRIVKFEGCYHGHADSLLVKAGSGLATFGEPDSAGVPAGAARDTLTLPYNDLAALERCFAEQGSTIAAVIVEPVAGNMGCVPPEPGFLEGLVSVCARHGALSIFDEVMTGFRVAPGGAQQRWGLRPDLTCLGKVVGGGMPLAVYGGREEVMRRVSPLGPVYQAGTLSGNPLATAAGLATLALLDEALYERLERLGALLEEGLRGAFATRGERVAVQRVGSMLTAFFGVDRVRSWSEARGADTAAFAAWHARLLEHGVYWPPSQFEAAFLSGAHSEEDVERIVAATRG